MTETVDLEAVVTDYLEAFDQRDLQRCMAFIEDTASIDFASGLYRGKEDIEQWHQDRFDADLRLLSVDKIKTKDDKVTVDATATSNVARVWRFNKVRGRVTFIFNRNKIKEMKFVLRMRLPIEGW